MHASYSLTHELKTLNTEQKQDVDDIIDKKLEQEKTLASLNITADNTNSNMHNNQVSTKHLLHTIKHKKSEAEKFLTDIIRQFGDGNKDVAPIKFHITSMTNLRPLLSRKSFVRPNITIDQPNLQICNHQNHFINMTPLRSAQAQ